MEKTSNGIELWAKEFEKLPRVPLTSELFVKFGFYLIAENAKTLRDKLQDILQKSDDLGKIIYNRVRCCHTYTLSIFVATFIGNYIVENPAQCTMLANYMQYWAWKNGVEKITMVELEMMFHDGYPTQEAWKKAWKLQKINRDVAKGEYLDNGLDYGKFGESIREIKGSKNE